MPIVAFSSTNDGLGPERRARGHFIADTSVDDNAPWIPYAEGVWFQPCLFNVTSGGFSLILKGLPGAKLGVHYHVGTVQGYTLRGRWRYLEHEWIAGPGTFVYESAGEAHTLVIPEDSPEPALVFFSVEGALVYLDGPAGGAFLAYEDAFSALELSRNYYRDSGRDPRLLDRLIR